MYTILRCHSPFGRPAALITYFPDRMGNGELRSWQSAERFAEPPPTPIEIVVEEGEGGELLELYDATIGLMSKRFAAALQHCGVANVDFYEAVISDIETGERHETHVAFNVIGAVSAADVTKSRFAAPGGLLVAVDFDELVLDAAKARGADFFRLAESVNAIVVSDRVRTAVLAAGIDTLSFVEPEHWVG